MRGAVLIAAASAAFLACGVRGPPRPPLREVALSAAPPASIPTPGVAPCAPQPDAGASAPAEPPPAGR